MRPPGVCDDADFSDGAEMVTNGFSDIYSVECFSARAVATRPLPLGGARLMQEVENLMSRQQVELISCLDSWLHQPQTCSIERLPSKSSARRPSHTSLSPSPSAHSNNMSTTPYTPCLALAKTVPDMKMTGTMGKVEAKVLAGRKRKEKPRTARASDFLIGARSEEAKQTESLLQQITRGPRYELCSVCLIVTNAVFLGWETQFLAERMRDDAMQGLDVRQGLPWVFTLISIAFTVCFTVELTLRWVAEGFREFFDAKDRAWNVLDVAIVFFSIFDSFLELFIGGAGGSITQNLAVLRMIRIVRIARVFKVIRVMKFFRELRIMVFSLFSSLKLLLWVMVVFGVMFFIFGVCFTNATTMLLETAAMWTSPKNAALVTHFGTLDKSFLSLYMAMSGGNDWGVYYDAMMPLDFHYRLVFLIFITFALFAVVNIVMGVFVETAVQSNHKDREFVVREELEAKQTYLESMRSVFEEMDSDGTGCITLQEFESKLSDERVVAYFNALKLDVSDARTLFTLLDHDRSDEVSIHEFLSGCYKLQGESRSLDLKIMQCEVKFLTENFGSFEAKLREVLDHLIVPVVSVDGGEDNPSSG